MNRFACVVCVKYITLLDKWLIEFLWSSMHKNRSNDTNDCPIDFRKELETPSLIPPSMRAWTNVGVPLNINIVGETKQNKIRQQNMTYGIKLVV